VKAIFFALLLCIALAPRAGHAETQTFSYSTWNVMGPDVRVRVQFPKHEADRLVPSPMIPSTDAVAKYVLKHLAVSSAGGQCTVENQEFEIGLIDTLYSKPNFYQFEVFFKCRNPMNIVLHDSVLFDLSSHHIGLARVQMNRSGYVVKLVTAGHEDIALPAGGRTLRSAGFVRSVKLGFEHLLSSPVRLAAVLAFLLLLGGWRDIGRGVAALGLGYAIAAALGAVNVVVPDASLTRALIGGVILLIAAQAVARESERFGRVASIVLLGFLVLAFAGAMAHRLAASELVAGGGIFAASWLAIARRHPGNHAVRVLPIALFGFLDGLYLVPELSVLQPPVHELVPIFSGLRLGSFVASLLILVIAAGVAMLWRMRATRALAWRAVAIDCGATACCGIGVYLLVGQMFG